MKIVMYACGAAAIALLGAGALSMSAGAPFDYAGATPKRQQAILDEMAAALQYGLVRATGGALAVRKAAGDATTDSLAIVAEIADRRFEAATLEQVAVVSRNLSTNMCNQLGTRRAIEDGVSIHISIALPNGAPPIDLQLDGQSCAPLFRARVG